MPALTFCCMQFVLLTLLILLFFSPTPTCAVSSLQHTQRQIQNDRSPRTTCPNVCVPRKKARRACRRTLGNCELKLCALNHRKGRKNKNGKMCADKSSSSPPPSPSSSPSPSPSSSPLPASNCELSVAPSIVGITAVCTCSREIQASTALVIVDGISSGCVGTCIQSPEVQEACRDIQTQDGEIRFSNEVRSAYTACCSQCNGVILSGSDLCQKDIVVMPTPTPPASGCTTFTREEPNGIGMGCSCLIDPIGLAQTLVDGVAFSCMSQCSQPKLEQTACLAELDIGAKGSAIGQIQQECCVSCGGVPGVSGIGALCFVLPQ